MKYRFLVRAALVITLGLPPMVAGAQTGDFVNGLVTKIDESAGRIVIKHGIASTPISRSQRSKKPSETESVKGRSEPEIPAGHHVCILTNTKFSVPVPCSQKRTESPTPARALLAEAATRNPVVLAESRPTISS